ESPASLHLRQGTCCLELTNTPWRRGSALRPHSVPQRQHTGSRGPEEINGHMVELEPDEGLCQQECPGDGQYGPHLVLPTCPVDVPQGRKRDAEGQQEPEQARDTDLQDRPPPRALDVRFGATPDIALGAAGRLGPRRLLGAQADPER